MSVFKRGQRWYIRNRVNGRDLWRSLGPGITTRSQAEAVQRQVEKEQLLERLAIIDPSRVTLDSFRRQYLEERRGHIAEKSIERYDVSLRMLAADLGENTLLGHLTARKIDQWASSRLARGVSPAGVNADLRHIKAALRKAADWGLIQAAPKIAMIKTPKRLPRHITPEDLETLLDAEIHPHRKNIWTFLLWTGCRRAEALSIQWQDISWDPKPSVRVIGKGDQERIVPLLPPAVQSLGTPKDIGPVFGNMHPDTLTHWWQTLVRACGLPNIRLHDLRHTAATFMISKGINIKVVQTIMGHSDIRVTMEYAKGLVGDLYDEMSKLL